MSTRPPEMQERYVAIGAHFVVRSGEPREPLAVFAHLGRTRGAHRVEGPSQLVGQLHPRRIIEQDAVNGKSFLVTTLSSYLNKSPVTLIVGNTLFHSAEMCS